MLHYQNTKSAIYTARFLELEQNQDPLSPQIAQKEVMNLDFPVLLEIGFIIADSGNRNFHSL